MKVTDSMVKQMAEKLAELIAAEMASTHRAAMLIHEEDIEIFVKVMDLANRRNPIEGKSLQSVRDGLQIVWDNSKVLSGRDMDFLARALDIAQEQDKWKEDSAKHWLAAAY